MSGLPRWADDNVLVGNQTSDDAAVVRLRDDLAIVHTIDFFMPIVDDPYDFGRIAAANALSDVYAMGAEPSHALAVMGLPVAKLPIEVGARILEGGGAVCREAGIQIVGGHSIDDTEPKFGLAVVGIVHPDRVWRNNTGREGDLLVLTKPLGTGALSSAVKKGALSPQRERALVDIMSRLNRDAAIAGRSVAVHAATDVTGFSLIGHGLEMADGAHLALELWVDELPLIDGILDVLEQGIGPGATTRNLAHFGPRIDFAGDVTAIDQRLLADPQTSGGLLFAVAPQDAPALQEALKAQGTLAAHVVGRLTAGTGARVSRRRTG